MIDTKRDLHTLLKNRPAWLGDVLINYEASRGCSNIQINIRTKENVVIELTMKKPDVYSRKPNSVDIQDTIFECLDLLKPMLLDKD